MKYKIFFLFFPIFFISGCTSATQTRNETFELQTNSPEINIAEISASAEKDWNELKPGLQYRSYSIYDNSNNKKQIFIVKIDPQKFSFHIYENKQRRNAKSIQEIHIKTQSLLSFNGSFFSENFEPLGLLVSEKKIIHKLIKSRLLNGIFTIRNDGKAELFQQENFPAEKDYQFALQSGPILLDKNSNVQIQTDSQKKAGRTALGIDKDNHIIVIILQQNIFQLGNSISLYEFANLLKKPPFADFGLHSVINLDGGRSTGLTINSISYNELEKVQNIITVHQKK